MHRIFILGCLLFMGCYSGGQTIARWDFENVATLPDPPLLPSSRSNLLSIYYADLFGGNTIGSPDVCGGQETWASNFWTTASSRRSSDYIIFDLRVRSSSDRALRVQVVSLQASVSSSNAADQFDLTLQVGNQTETLARGESVGTSCRSYNYSVNLQANPGDRIRLRLYPYGQNPGAQAATLRIDNVFIGGVSLLPVTWHEVAARADQAGVRISWSTATETNTDYFTVERSTDGQHYSPLRTIPAAGYSQQIRYYAYRDRRPHPGTNYYRILQMDRDGQFSYSRILAVDWSRKQSRALTLAQNPVGDNLQIEGLRHEERARVRIFQVNGRVWEDQWLEPGQSIPVSHLPRGMYLLQVQSSRRREMIRWIKGD